MTDVICLGEALVDLVPTVTGHDLEHADTFTKAAGGAPANVAVGLARLGVSAAFMGCVGNDGFGRFLATALVDNGVDATMLRVSADAPTALAVVSLGADADRDFVFYGYPAAHTLFAPADVDEAAILAAKILHIGAIGLVGGPLRDTTLHAVAIARRAGVRVSYAPNLRLSLWPNAEAAREDMRLGLSLADLVTIGATEVEFLAGDACDLVEGARALWHPGLRVMAVTRGARGALWLNARSEREHAGYPVAAVDTTGAGDAFTAGFLASLVDHAAPTDSELDAAVRFGNAAGALATTTRGAIPAMPHRAAVHRLMAENGADHGS